MKRLGLILLVLLLSLTGCGWFGGSGGTTPAATPAPLTRRELREDQDFFLGEVKKGIVKTVDPVKERLTKIEGQLVDLDSKVTNEGMATRTALDAYARAGAGYQNDIIGRLTTHDAALAKIQGTLTTAISTPVAIGGWASPGGSGVGQIETVATLGGVKVTFKGPASLEEARRIMEEQQRNRERERAATLDRSERAVLIRALQNKQSSYDGLNKRVTTLEQMLDTHLRQIELTTASTRQDVALLRGDVNQLGIRQKGILAKLDDLAKEFKLVMRYTQPRPMPPTHRIKRCGDWNVYINEVSGELYGWA
jgi:hypothetical protein